MSASDPAAPPAGPFAPFLPSSLGQSAQGDSRVIQLVDDTDSLLPCAKDLVSDFFTATGFLGVLQAAVPTAGPTAGLRTLKTELTGIFGSPLPHPVSRLDVGLEADQAGVSYVAIDIGWTPQPQIDLSPLPVKLVRICLSLCFFPDPGGTPRWTAVVRASAELFGAFDCEFAFDITGSQISVWGRPDGSPMLGSQLGSVTIPAALSGHLSGKVTVQSFQGLLDFESGDYEVAIQLGGQVGWQQFSLDSLELRLAYSGGTHSFFLGAEALVGNVGVQLALEGDGSGDLGFTGTARLGQDASLKDFISGVCTNLGVAIPTLPFDLTLTGLSLFIQEVSDGAHKSVSFSASCAAALLMEGTGSSIELDLGLAKSGSSLDVTLRVGGLSMELSEQDGAFTFAADPSTGSAEISFGEVVRILRLTALEDLPVDLDLKLDGAFLSVGAAPATGGSRPVLFGVQVDVSTLASLSGPIVGIVTAGGGSLGVTSIAFFAANQPWSADELSGITNPGGVTLPATLPKGPSVVPTLSLGVNSVLAPLVPSHAGTPAGSSSSGGAGTGSPPPSPVPQPASSSSATRWFNVQKSVGPLLLRRAGFALGKDDSGDPRLTIALDGSFVVAGMTLGLDGLQVGFPLSWDVSASDVQVELRGMELAFERPPLSIGGGFVHQSQNGVDVYEGNVLLDVGSLALAAVGEYAEINGGPSMFVYLALDDPLGGPPAFFVTGLSAGFGYSSRLTLPATAADVASFILVRAATGQATLSPSTIASSLTPEAGYDWLAVGVQFRSFELLQSVAIVTATFGNALQFELLGQSELSIPPSSTEPIAYAQVDLLATYSPAAGELRVYGQLTSTSYVLSKDCHLSGGFAFRLWATGDFVASLGGYNPTYDYAAHGYPAVAPLELLWQIDSHTCIKGSEYFAITPGAMMAGGSLSATWTSGIFSAWFDVGVDLFLGWRPFHYEGSFEMSLGVRFTLNLWVIHVDFSFHIGASLQVQGPPFSGTATIDLDVISFEVSFGPGPGASLPLSWTEFRAMLPGDAANDVAPSNSDLISAKVTGGLLPTAGGAGSNAWIIDGTHFRLVIESAIPVLDGSSFCASASYEYAQAPGVRPMQQTLASSNLTAGLTGPDGKVVTLSADSTQPVCATPVLRNVPMAHWGADTTSLEDGSIENALVGFTLSGGRLEPGRETAAIDVASVLTEPTSVTCLLASTTTSMGPFPAAAGNAGASGGTPSSTAAATIAELTRLGIL